MIQGIPNFLYEKLIKQYGEETTNKIIEGYSKNRPVTLRVNTLKNNIQNVKEIFANQESNVQEVSWYKNALIIPKRSEGTGLYDTKKYENEIRQLDIYNNGEIYLQSLSSMMPVIMLEPKPEENILDMAAAPGGKTTQIASETGDKSFITACEKNKIRCERLKYNIEKQGAKRITILSQDARELDNFFSFDKILLDAPCSGSGTLSLEDEKLEKIFTEELVTRSVKTQMELLKKAITVLKSGHEMIYSTCSILKEENEENLSKILKTGKVELVPIDMNKQEFKDIPLLPVTIEGTVCVCPSELYEGFFIAKLRKK